MRIDTIEFYVVQTRARDRLVNAEWQNARNYDEDGDTEACVVRRWR